MLCVHPVLALDFHYWILYNTATSSCVLVCHANGSWRLRLLIIIWIVGAVDPAHVLILVRFVLDGMSVGGWSMRRTVSLWIVRG